MDFYALLDEIVTLLRSRDRVSYRALKLQFQLDDDYLRGPQERTHLPAGPRPGRGICMCPVRTAALPVAVRPTMTIKSSLQAACRDQCTYRRVKE